MLKMCFFKIFKFWFVYECLKIKKYILASTQLTGDNLSEVSAIAKKFRNLPACCETGAINIFFPMTQSSLKQQNGECSVFLSLPKKINITFIFPNYIHIYEYIVN